MSECERQVNSRLRALDDAHRLGRIPRAEYRCRRRHLLASLRNEACSAARDTLRRPAPAAESLGPAAYAQRYGGRRLKEATATRARLVFCSRQLAVSVGVVALGIVLFYWLVLHI